MLEKDYCATITQLRKERATAIGAKRSWLSLAGLYWLQPGKNCFGTSTENPIILPGSAAIAHAGVFTLRDDTVTIAATADTLFQNRPLQINGQAIQEQTTEQPLQHDMTAAPDVVTLGDLSMIVIKRGDRFGIRLYDDASVRRQTFQDLDWYPVDPTYRITARFVPYEPPKAIHYGNVLGDLLEEQCPGAVVFTLGGVDCRLDAQPRGDKLFFNFRDETNGDTTYGAGRFLYADMPKADMSKADMSKDMTVVVDFNQATNPYCAYTVYATCPLPPTQNRLPIRIEAGERKFLQ